MLKAVLQLGVIAVVLDGSVIAGWRWSRRGALLPQSFPFLAPVKLVLIGTGVVISLTHWRSIDHVNGHLILKILFRFSSDSIHN